MKKFADIMVKAFAVAAIACMTCGVCRHCRGGEEQATEMQRDTIMERDTVFVEKPIVRDSVIMRTKIVRVKALIAADSVAPSTADSVDVQLTVTQKHYADSLYEAWVSGVEPSLDSIKVYQQTKIITIKEAQRHKRWNIGVTAGAGMTPKGVQPFVGVGVSYSIFSF